MDFKFKKIQHIKGQECFDTEEVWFEILDADENTIGEIRCAEEEDYEIIIYNQNIHIAFSISELQSMINQAQVALGETSAKKIEKMARVLNIT